jgi:predicted Zn-dependent protease
MQPNLRLAAVVTLVAAGAGIAAMGSLEHQIGFDSVREIWGDLVRDADQVAMKAAPVSIPQEVALGQKLSAAMKDSWQEDGELSTYVTAIGQQFLPALRRGQMPYHFHVVDSPQVNAFALPGGEIYVFRGLLEFVETEAELAAVIGHEMAHVDLKHCLDHYRYQLALQNAGAGELGQVVDLSRRLATVSYTQFQEVEADAEGWKLAVSASYDPDAAANLFERMGKVFEGKVTAHQRNPAGELIKASASVLTDYFRSHPRSADRAQRLSELTRSHYLSLTGKQFYEGRKNLAKHIPLSEKAFDNEWRRMK